MAFREQTIGVLLDARQAASELLRAETEWDNRRFTLQQTLLLQAASHILLTESSFYAAQLAHLTGMDHGSISKPLATFTAQRIIEPSGQQIVEVVRSSKRYVPTELGAQVFAIFQDENESLDTNGIPGAVQSHVWIRSCHL